MISFPVSASAFAFASEGLKGFGSCRLRSGGRSGQLDPAIFQS